MNTVPSQDAKEHYTVTAEMADAGLRLDAWLARTIPGLSRAQVQKLIAEGWVRLNGARVLERRRIVRAGDWAAVDVPEAVDQAAQGERMALNVVFEDKDIIVIDKPAGLVVHPGAGHASGTLVNALIAHCGASLSGIGGIKRPGIVHRLDKDTSGLLVVAKNDAAHCSLSEQFKSHGADGRLQRTYLAIVWGVPVRTSGMIDAPLARSARNRTKIAVVRNESQGRRAVTHYRVLERYQGVGRENVASLLELTLETGRTHQIRVHLAHIGHPVLGTRSMVRTTRRGSRIWKRRNGSPPRRWSGRRCTLRALPSGIRGAPGVLPSRAIYPKNFSGLLKSCGKRQDRRLLPAQKDDQPSPNLNGVWKH